MNPYESFIRFDENSTIHEVKRDGVEVILSFEDEGYPFPISIDKTRVHYRWGDGEWKSGPVSEEEDGNLSAFIPKVSRDRHLDYFFEMVDTDGRSVTEPLFAPNLFHSVDLSQEGTITLEFGPATLFVMLFTLGTIWGGFILGITKALRSGKGRK
jgi:hypothetical protein